MKGSAINNYAGTVGIIWDRPGQTGKYGHPATVGGFGKVTLLLCKMDVMAALPLQGSHED